jgi:hypothetical protein
MAPEDARAKSIKLRDEMTAALPRLSGPVAEAAAQRRAESLRVLAQEIDFKRREAVNQRISAERSPHMATRADETEKEVALLVKAADAAERITDSEWWAKASTLGGKQFAQDLLKKAGK